MSEHRVPVIDRMVDMLTRLEQADGLVSIRELAAGCGVPRTTVYRILNTLEAHDVVVRTGAEGYQLGSRLVAWAARVPKGAAWQRLSAWAQPWLQLLANETNETVKLSVADRDAALCLAVAEGRSEFAVAARVGGRYPFHAGAASKVLLAAMPASERSRLFARGLDRFTDRSVTDPAALQGELDRIAAAGWAEDTGEFSLSVRAVAAPVRDAAGRVVAAISAVFLADRSDERQTAYRDAVCRVARDMGAAPD